MAKKTKKDETNDINDNLEYVKTELTRLHPVRGDVFVLNIDSDDPDIIYSEDILESVEKLSETLEDLTGIAIPILVFGTEVDLSIFDKEDLLDLQEHIQEILDEFDEEEKTNDTEHLIDQFA